MDASEIPRLVQKTWDAIVPPIVEAFFVAVVFWLVADMPTVSIEKVFGITPKQLLPSEDVQKALTFYGMPTVLPIAIFISVVGISQIVGRIIRILGGVTPPHLAENTTASMVQVMDEWTLRKLWVCQPSLNDINGLNRLYLQVEEAIVKAKIDPKAHHRLKGQVYLREEKGRRYDQFVFIKGLIAWAVIAWLLVPVFAFSRSGGWQVLTLILALLLLCVIAIYRYVDVAIRCRKYDVQAYIDVLCSELPEGGEPSSDTVKRDSERIDSIKKSDCKQIWSIHLMRFREKSLAKAQILGAFKNALRLRKRDRQR